MREFRTKQERSNAPYPSIIDPILTAPQCCLRFSRRHIRDIGDEAEGRPSPFGVQINANRIISVTYYFRRVSGIARGALFPPSPAPSPLPDDITRMPLVRAASAIRNYRSIWWMSSYIICHLNWIIGLIGETIKNYIPCARIYLYTLPTHTHVCVLARNHGSSFTR